MNNKSIAENQRHASATRADARWASVVARDAGADGTFVYSVKTTGVYCRPSCAARLARPENVLFYKTCDDAEAAGFRPCKRCKPDEPSLVQQHASTVARLCRLIEASDEAPSLSELAKRAGMSAFHFHRVFKAITGVTPKAYTSAKRANRMREKLSSVGTVTEAIYDAGYNSNARFYERANDVLGMKPSRYRAGAPMATSGSPLANAF